MGNTGSVISGGFDEIGKGVAQVAKQIETGIGAVGQSVGDLFYTDNPNRRARVEQLQNDINVMQNDFNSLKKSMEEQLAGLQRKLTELLKANQFNSVDEMDAYMQKTLNENTLADWNEFKKTLNRDIAIENMVMTATGLLAIATGVVAYGLAICGAITFASAGLAIEVTGAIALALTAAIAIIAIIDAHNEREVSKINQLQEAITKLAFSRVEAKQALEQLRVYTTFLASFDTFLSSDLLKGHPEWFNQFTSGNVITSLEGIVWPKIVRKVKELDEVRPEHAWRNEDPDLSVPANGGVDRVQEILNKYKDKKTNASKLSSLVRMEPMLLPGVSLSEKGVHGSPLGVEQPVIQFIHEKTSSDEVVEPQNFRLKEYQSALDCDCEDMKTHSTWHIHANLSETPSKAVELKNVLFTITNKDTGNVFNNCRILLLGHAVSA